MKNKKNKRNGEKNTPEVIEQYKKLGNILTIIFLLSIFSTSFYFKGIAPMKNGFGDGVYGFAMDDAVFHMRLVENTIANFPTRIFYDAFTQFPYGSRIHWGALFDTTIAFIAIIVGRIVDNGAPSENTINTIGMFFPAVLGALVVFPVYIIGKTLYGKKAGLISAFLIAILPGQFMNRATLGFTDNHVMEVLLLTLTVMFMLLAFKKGDGIKLHESNLHKPLLLFSVGAGISLGLYLLNWTAGIFFVAVFACALLLQVVIDTLKKKDTDYLMVIGCITFFIPFIMVLPYVQISNGFDSAYYSLLHELVLLVSITTVVIMRVISNYAIRTNLSRSIYLMYLSCIVIFGVVLTRLISPGTIDFIITEINFIFTKHTGGTATVSEAVPITQGQIMAFFGYNFYFAFLGLLILIYYSVFQSKKSDASSTLIIIWTAITYLIMLAQNRWAYYYAVNVAVLTGIIGAYIMNRLGWTTLNRIKISHIVSAIFVIVIVGFLPFGSSIFDETLKTSKYGSVGAGFYEWWEAMTWMRNNTPDTGLDYYGIYKRPPAGEEYPYPDTAYGVLSWWDYGHVITYWGHRIPNANPFQSGIGGGANHSDGVATFLTAQDETEGTRILKKLKAKYVVTDAYMGYSIQGIFATWNMDDSIVDPIFSGAKYPNPNKYYMTAIRTNEGMTTIPGLKSYRSMAGRFHILDGLTLKQYRLVHESQVNPNALAAKNNKYGLEQQYKYVWNALYGGNISVIDSGYVKVFEFVEGAKIVGTTAPNTSVVIGVPIQTNIGRTFIYAEMTKSDSVGAYNFTVPYSTEGTIPTGTNFDTKPSQPYTIYFTDTEVNVHVKEDDVLKGNTVVIVTPKGN